MPDVSALRVLADATQEVVFEPLATKSRMPRRKLTDDDKSIIDRLASKGLNSSYDIAQETGLAQSSVLAYLSSREGR